MFRVTFLPNSLWNPEHLHHANCYQWAGGEGWPTETGRQVACSELMSNKLQSFLQWHVSDEALNLLRKEYVMKSEFLFLLLWQTLQYVLVVQCWISLTPVLAPSCGAYCLQWGRAGAWANGLVLKWIAKTHPGTDSVCMWMLMQGRPPCLRTGALQ